MKSRDQILTEQIENGAPPPMMSGEGAAEAEELGKWMSGANAFEFQKNNRFGKKQNGEKL